MASTILELEAANGVLYGTLLFMIISTIIIGSVFHKDQLKTLTNNGYHGAHNTQGFISLSLSFFASSAGAWILYTVPEAAILGGPVAVAGYTISCLVPLLIFACVGPYMRRNVPTAYTFFDYVQGRFGTPVNIYATLISLFYMFLYLSAEFKSLGDSFCSLAEGSLERPDNCLLGPVIGTSMATLVYTAIGGLPVSLLTDKVQGVGVFIFTILVAIATFTVYDLPDESDDPKVKDNWELATSTGINDDYGESFKMAFILISAVTCANLMHAGFQQRIFAAENDRNLILGAMGGVLLTIPCMCFFGVIGFIAFANKGDTLVVPDYLAFLATFFVIHDTAVGWQVLGLILAVLMVASSADTIQTGCAALLQPITRLALGKSGLVREPSDPKNDKLVGVINFVLTACLINIPAIILASDVNKYTSKNSVSVLSLFVLADLACATCCVPLLMGLSNRIHPLAAFVGCLTGFTLAMIIYGVGVDDENDKVAPWYEYQGAFSMLLKPGGLYSDTALTAFIVVPVGSGIMTLVSSIPFVLKGYRFPGFPKNDTSNSDVTARGFDGISSVPGNCASA
mmetsp:Transcript_7449/g.12618  ORF Transcript_7449/g.12618 Transcript_7449/m.12618 type:complete len:569 (-) Transcript_7449:500-2206(-)